MKSLAVLLFLPEMQITLVWCIHAVAQQVCQKKTNCRGSPAIDPVISSDSGPEADDTDSCRVNSLTLHPNAYFTSAHRVLPSHLITKVQYSMRHQLLLQTYPIIDLLCLLYKLYHRYVWIGKAHTAFGTIHVQAATGRLGPHPLWRRGDNYTKQERWTLLRK